MSKLLMLACEELYSVPLRAFWELLQNADDCIYDETPHLKARKFGTQRRFAQVIHCPEYLWLEYNEQGFSLEDVEALCSLGASTKGLGQTGDKGIGFKAAFVLSARPHVLSTYQPLAAALCGGVGPRFFFDEAADCPLPQVRQRG